MCVFFLAGKSAVATLHSQLMFRYDLSRDHFGVTPIRRSFLNDSSKSEMSTYLFLDRFMAVQDRPTKILIFAGYVTIAYTVQVMVVTLPFTFRSFRLKSLVNVIPCQLRITQGVDYI